MPPAKDDDAAFSQVADGLVVVIRLTDLVHFKGAHHPRVEPIFVLKKILQSDSVHYHRHHPHPVGGHSIPSEKLFLQLAASDYVSAPGYDDQFMSVGDRFYLTGDESRALAVVRFAGPAECLPADFQKNPLFCQLVRSFCWILGVVSWRTLAAKELCNRCLSCN